jgi:hypothetical protein
LTDLDDDGVKCRRRHDGEEKSTERSHFRGLEGFDKKCQDGGKELGDKIDLRRIN